MTAVATDLNRKQNEVLCLCDVFQNIKGEFHDDRALIELTGPSVDHRHQSAVQVVHVLRGKGLAVAPCLVANLHHREKGTGYWTEISPEGYGPRRQQERQCEHKFLFFFPELSFIILTMPLGSYETSGKTLNLLRPVSWEIGRGRLVGTTARYGMSEIIPNLWLWRVKW